MFWVFVGCFSVHQKLVTLLNPEARELSCLQQIRDILVRKTIDSSLVYADLKITRV
jgi:hypothetical protein